MGTLRSDSQVSLLHRDEPVLRLIRSYLKPENNTTYRVRMQFCMGCCQQNESPFLEALVGCGGVPDNYDPKKWKKSGVGKQTKKDEYGNWIRLVYSSDLLHDLGSSP